jgi:hypothetical protein
MMQAISSARLVDTWAMSACRTVSSCRLNSCSVVHLHGGPAQVRRYLPGTCDFPLSAGFAPDAAGFLGLTRSKNSKFQFNRTDVDDVAIRERRWRFDEGVAE